MSLTTENATDCFREPVPIFVQPQLALFPGSSKLIAVTGGSLRRMVTDALRAGRLIAVAHNTTHEQNVDAGRSDVVSLARIVTPAFLAPDANHMQLKGVCRARVVSARQVDASYHLAMIEVCPDRYAANSVIDRNRRRKELLILFRGLFPHVVRDDLFQLWDEDDDSPLGVTCDLIADLLPIEPRRKQPLLAESDVDLRSDLLLDRLRALSRAIRNAAVKQSANPRFSAN